MLKFTLSVLFFGLCAFSQNPVSGIYIVKKPEKKNPCEQELKMLIGKKGVCVLKKPIIGIEELEYVTDILYDTYLKTNYINLGLSSASANTLNSTVSILPKTQFALVVNGEVICLFTITDKMDTRYLKLGMDLDIKNLIVVHDALKQVQY